MDRTGTDNPLYKQPVRLITELAQSGEARLRLSVIPLFLEHPEYASYVRKAAKGLHPSALLTLQCYYTAAVWLAKKTPNQKRIIARSFLKSIEHNACG